MRFIHTADWHLGRIFHGVHLIDDQAYIMKEFLQIIKDTKAEAVVIAGDIYDRGVPPVEAVELFDEVLTKLRIDMKIPVLFISGNHDSDVRLGFGSRLMKGQGLYICGRPQVPFKPVVLEDKFGKVYFSLYPYVDPAAIRAAFGIEDRMDFNEAQDIMVKEGFSHIPEGARSVAVAHAFLAGGQASDSERVLTVGGSSNVSPGIFKDYSYTALGHLHNPQTAGGENIRYSGSLMKYSFDEANQKKGVNLVDLDGNGKVSVDFIPLDPKHDVRRVRGQLEDIRNNRELYPYSEDYILVELMDRGAVLDAHGKLENIYPNLLQIQRPELAEMAGNEFHGRDIRKSTELELFGDFFKAMTGEKMDEPQEKAVSQAINSVIVKSRNEDREAGL